MLCEKLKRKWLSCELHKPYYEMILDRLKNGGIIKEEFRLSLGENYAKNRTQDSLFGAI